MIIDFDAIFAFIDRTSDSLIVRGFLVLLVFFIFLTLCAFIVASIFFLFLYLLVECFSSLFNISDIDIESRLTRDRDLATFLWMQHEFFNRDILSEIADDIERRTKRQCAVDTLMPLVKYGSCGEIEPKSDECVICLRVFEDGDSCRVLPSCRHMFHSNCIDCWLLSDKLTCPVCRRCVEGL